MPMKRILLVSVICLSAMLHSWADTQLKPYQDYIRKYAPDAMRQQIKYGIPSSITLAQGLLESNAGNSEMARQSNNHFGIKCHNDWKGETYRHWDDGEMSCFRKYKTVLDSYNDHSLFLVTKSRYDFLFDLNVKDYKGWAKGLKKAGYATDKQYDKKLIRIIEQYDLTQYDRIATHPGKAKRLMRHWDDYTSADARPQTADAGKAVAVAGAAAATTAAKAAPAAAAAPAAKATQSKSEPAKEKPAKEKASTQSKHRSEVAAKAKDYSYLAQESAGTPTRNLYNHRTDNLPQSIHAVRRHQLQYRGSTPYIVAQYGDSYTNLADEYNLSPARIRNINDLPKDYTLKVGDVVYLGRKADVWDGDNATHRVKSGESLHAISQKYAIRMDALYKLNGMRPGQRIEVGQELKLR